MPRLPITELKVMKQRGEKIPMLTAYDYPTARPVEQAGVPIILVGDSLGMVVLGYPNTTHVTMPEMEHHVRAAARARPNALLGADLPFRSYETVEQAVANALRLIAAGAEYVKAEGGREMAQRVGLHEPLGLDEVLVGEGLREEGRELEGRPARPVQLDALADRDRGGEDGHSEQDEDDGFGEPAHRAPEFNQ